MFQDAILSLAADRPLHWQGFLTQAPAPLFCLGFHSHRQRIQQARSLSWSGILLKSTARELGLGGRLTSPAPDAIGKCDISDTMIVLFLYKLLIFGRTPSEPPQGVFSLTRQGPLSVFKNGAAAKDVLGCDSHN